jgi:hypothetical protein
MTADLDKDLAVLTQRVNDIDDRTVRIEDKLDQAIACKADKTEVDSIKETQTAHDRAIAKLYGALALVAVGIPVFLWLIEKAFNK